MATAVLILLILADVIVEVVALAKTYLAAGAVAGWGVAGGCSCCYGCA